MHALFFKKLTLIPTFENSKKRDKCLLLVIGMSILNELLFNYIHLCIICTLCPNKVYWRNEIGNSLVVQCLGLHASTAGGKGSIPGQGTKIQQAVQHGQKMKKEKYAIMTAHEIIF